MANGSHKEPAATASKVFRFRDLPPELRDRIYSYSFLSKRNTPYNLASFKNPAVAVISRQLRSEAHPILFKECKWVITVGANYLEPHRWQKAGNLGLKVRCKKFVRSGGGTAIFRSVRFRIFMVNHAIFARAMQHTDEIARRGIS